MGVGRNHEEMFETQQFNNHVGRNQEGTINNSTSKGAFWGSKRHVKRPGSGDQATSAVRDLVSRGGFLRREEAGANPADREPVVPNLRFG